MKELIIVIISVFVGAFGQIYFKKGMASTRIIGMLNTIKGAAKVFSNPAVLLGLILYAISSILWLFAMTRLDISLMYPLTSLGYFITAIFASKMLGEKVNSSRWIGISLIFLGSLLVMFDGI